MSSLGPDRPALAILFWYYKFPDVCRSRVRALRRLHPTASIFGLYGGDPANYPDFADLNRCLDDNWCFDTARDTEWKWLHGDQMINEWFNKRGRELVWDSVAIVQWDMLVCAPLDQVFEPLGRQDVYLPGVRPVEDVRAFWWWAQPDTPQEAAMNGFVRGLGKQHQIRQLLGCQFLCAVLPRRFLELYGSMPDGENGFLEYKLPTCAEAFGLHLRDYPQLAVSWPGDPRDPGPVLLSARKEPIRARDILRAWLQPAGVRLFHPVHDVYARGIVSVAAAAIREAMRDSAQRMKTCLKSTVGPLRRRS